MTAVRELMREGAEMIQGDTSVFDAAKTLDTTGYGAVPVCDGESLIGMLTDRDIVLRVVSQKRDPDSTPVKEVMTPGEVVTIGADDDIEEAVRTMSEHNVRRLPVIDGTRVVGMLSQADLAKSDRASDELVARVLEDISEAPENN